LEKRVSIRQFKQLPSKYLDCLECQAKQLADDRTVKGYQVAAMGTLPAPSCSNC
jgi:hypothetical protein